jgi:hypothetical protein
VLADDTVQQDNAIRTAQQSLPIANTQYIQALQAMVAHGAERGARG